MLRRRRDLNGVGILLDRPHLLESIEDKNLVLLDGSAHFTAEIVEVPGLAIGVAVDAAPVFRVQNGVLDVIVRVAVPLCCCPLLLRVLT